MSLFNTVRKRGFLLFVFFSLLLLAVSVFSGAVWIDPFHPGEMGKQILTSIRIPRVSASFLIGAGLGCSGAVLQGMLRNPLADPYILGISGGAGLFVSFSFVFLSGLNLFGGFSSPFFAFAGAVLTGLIVGLLSIKEGVIRPERLLLAGVGLGFLFSSAIMFVMMLSSNEGIRRTMLWMFGDLSMTDRNLLPYGAFLILSGFVLSLFRAKALNALILGDDMAYSLGFSPTKERILLLIATGLMTAAAVALGGIIGFIGLLIPHFVRFLFSSDSHVLLPLSAFAGGVSLTVADTIGRTLFSPVEVPAGIITALLGAPYFLFLLRRKV